MTSSTPESRSFSRARTRALFVVLLLGGVVWLQAASSAAALPQVVAQVVTPTPFRFLTPTPFVPGKTTTAPTTTTTPAPRAGGFPMELALPALASGVAAIGGGAYLLRRRFVR
jgi:hypothetical protein